MLDTPNYTPEQLNGLRRFFHSMNHIMIVMLRLGLGRMCAWWPEGFAGPLMGVDQRKLSDEQLDVLTRDYRLVHFEVEA